MLVNSAPPKCRNPRLPEGFLKWSGRRDSNSRRPPWQGGALPTELRPQNRVQGVGWGWRPSTAIFHSGRDDPQLPAPGGVTRDENLVPASAKTQLVAQATALRTLRPESHAVLRLCSFTVAAPREAGLVGDVCGSAAYRSIRGRLPVAIRYPAFFRLGASRNSVSGREGAVLFEPALASNNSARMRTSTRSTSSTFTGSL